MNKIEQEIKETFSKKKAQSNDTDMKKAEISMYLYNYNSTELKALKEYAIKTYGRR